MISKKEVQHIAKLARLGITETEVGRFQKDITAVLEYVEKLKKVDVSETKPASQPSAVENVKREDEVKADKKVKEKLLEMAPEIKDGFVKVKSVFD